MANPQDPIYEVVTKSLSEKIAQSSQLSKSQQETAAEMSKVPLDAKTSKRSKRGTPGAKGRQQGGIKGITKAEQEAMMLKDPKYRGGPGQVSPSGETRIKTGDIAKSLFNYYKTGEMPPPAKQPIDPTKVETRQMGKVELAKKQWELKQLKKQEQLRREQLRIVEALARGAGSKPPARPTLPGAIELGKERSARAASREAIQEQLRSKLTGAWPWSPTTREEQAIKDLEERKAKDKAEKKAAKEKAKVAKRDAGKGQVHQLAQSTLDREADRRVQEALKDIEKKAKEKEKKKEKPKPKYTYKGKGGGLRGGPVGGLGGGGAIDWETK